MKREATKHRAKFNPPWTCLHVLNGRVQGPKKCVYNYECYHCPFDQWLDWMDVAEGKVVRTAKGVAMTPGWRPGGGAGGASNLKTREAREEVPA